MLGYIAIGVLILLFAAIYHTAKNRNNNDAGIWK